MNIRNVLASGDVMRYHNARITKQNLSDHMWQVGIILQHIYPECSKGLLMYALTHDCEELYTGDIPAPIKSECPELKNVLTRLEEGFRYSKLELDRPDFSEKDMLAVKYADVLSGYYHTCKRIAAGESQAKYIQLEWRKYLKVLPYLNDRTQATIGDLG